MRSLAHNKLSLSSRRLFGCYQTVLWARWLLDLLSFFSSTLCCFWWVQPFWRLGLLSMALLWLNVVVVVVDVSPAATVLWCYGGGRPNGRWGDLRRWDAFDRRFSGWWFWSTTSDWLSETTGDESEWTSFTPSIFCDCCLCCDLREMGFVCMLCPCRENSIVTGWGKERVMITTEFIVIFSFFMKSFVIFLSETSFISSVLFLLPKIFLELKKCGPVRGSVGWGRTGWLSHLIIYSNKQHWMKNGIHILLNLKT